MQEGNQAEGRAGSQMQAAKKAPDKTSEIDEHISARFDVKKRLGKGAYGIVWKAVDRKTGEVVAIKKIFDAFRNQTDAQRTYREIFFLQAFRRHPNVIKLHSIHRALNNRDIYLGFEYMQTDLHNVIKCGNILKDIHKRYIMYQMLRATKYIHSGNVIHRDQKPSNVLIDNACRVKIADFGLARSVAIHNQGIGQGGADPCLTDYVATRWYRAPEILIASRSYTKGVDMWSLGCILGEMLVGKPLFPGSSTVNQIERIMSCIPQPSEADICAVCTGYGSSLIRTAVKRRISLREILGNTPSEAIDLTSCLLVFNPARRCSAGQALSHPYVSRFNIELNEPMMKADVIPPLREDLKLPIDEYRDKIYGLLRRGGSNDSETKKETTSTQKVIQRIPLCPVSPPKDLKETLKVESVKSQSPASLQKVEIVAKTPPQQPRVEIVPKSRIPTHFHNGTSKMSSNDALNQIKEKRKTMLHKNRSLEETTTANVDNRRIKCRSSIARMKTDYQKKPNNRKSVI